MTYEQFRQDCAIEAERLVGLSDILDDGDPYELDVAMADAFRCGDTPEQFIRDIFAEDIASAMNDRIMEAEAMESEYYEEDE